MVVGGCGRIGLPLAVALAGAGTRTAIYDVSAPAVAAVSAGRMPFAEPGAAVVLERVIAAGQLVASADPRIVGSAEHVAGPLNRKRAPTGKAGRVLVVDAKHRRIEIKAVLKCQ